MEDCPICYEAVNTSTGYCTLSCKHSFHISCLTKWSNETPSCPMCRHSLGTTEAPVKQLADAHMRWTGMEPGSYIGELVWRIQQELGPEPVQPPPPPLPRPSRILNIGGGVQVSEEDVAIVVEHAHVTRGAAVRALRRHEGCIVNSIMMLVERSEAVPQVPAPRDPTQTESDDQATAWFLQQMFADGGGYHWNSYSDMTFRMRNGLRAREYWTHRDFNEVPSAGDGYNSA